MGELVGKWKNTHNENFSEYLKALGVGAIKRAVMEKLHPDIDIVVTGDEWYIKTTMTFNTQENTFKIGVPFETDYKGITTGKMRAVASFEGGKLTIETTPVYADILGTVATREIIGSQMVQTLTCGDIIAKRYYVRK